ncbi:MAG: hypothetical protein B9S32_06515 [Verrucomicrobia bacterium Tous-C9LFEB]|nr:MAG: hypothetical protein B9S32_06515 [Verrucomicrobia bacterium Tous-C9LFEB]
MTDGSTGADHWIVTRRRVAAGMALFYFTNSALIAPGGWPVLGEVAFALVTIGLWFTPWLWARAWWLWWPSYLLSTLISVGLVKVIVAAWVMQFTHPDAPLFNWPMGLLYLFLSASVFGLFCVWQTSALFVHRVQPWFRRLRARGRKK